MRNSLHRSLLLASIVVLGCGPSGRHGGGDGGMNGNCPSGCKSCDASGKCQDCVPNQVACNGPGTVVMCNADGTLGAVQKQCDTANGEACNGGQCLAACDVAAATHSYIGCDYWPTTTLNNQLNPYFDFAVAVANPFSGDVAGADATVTVTKGGAMVKQVTVKSGDVQTIILPWVTELMQPPNCMGGFGCMPGPTPASTLVANGAYHLVSSIPVTVYQFNPLQFEKPSNQNCMDQPQGCMTNKDCPAGQMCQFGACMGGNTCHSYTNDASILLPSTALTNDYVVVARQTFSLNFGGGQGSAIPGFFAVVGTQNGTTVNVTYSANIQPGTGVKAAGPGSQATFKLDAGQVLEVVSASASSPCAQMSMETIQGTTVTYCDLGAKYDLTGTLVSADKPVAVFGGHSCSFVPYNKWACDHLEEQITPLDTWGKTVATVQTEPQTPAEPNVFRVVSGGDGNMIMFDPAVAMPTMLNKGQYVEFTAKGAFTVTGTEPLAVAQYMVGENYTTAMINVGDPSLGLGVPTEQYRTSYDFLTPDTYTKSYVNVIAPPAIHLMLDGNDISAGFTPIGAGMLGYKRLEIKPGAHHIASSDNLTFGITVSGIANFTSYLYVGGQNLSQINPG